MNSELQHTDETKGLDPIPDAFMFPIDRIDVQKGQPRSANDLEHIKRLAESIRKGRGRRAGGTGLIHPLLVRWKAGAFDAEGNIRPDARVEIVAGENRYEACRLAEEPFVPVMVTSMTSEEAFEDAVVENVLRGDLTPEDEGRSFVYLMNKHDLSFLGVAKMVYGDPAKQGYVRNRAELLGLNDIVRRLIGRRQDTMVAARRIQSVQSEEKQKELVEFMINGGTFKELSARIREIKGIVPTNKDDSDNRKALANAFQAGTPAPPFQFDKDPELEKRDDSTYSALKQISGQGGPSSSPRPAGQLQFQSPQGDSEREAQQIPLSVRQVEEELAELDKRLEKLSVNGTPVPESERKKLAWAFNQLRFKLARAEAKLEVV